MNIQRMFDKDIALDPQLYGQRLRICNAASSSRQMSSKMTKSITLWQKANIYKWNHLTVHKNIPSSRYNRFVPTRQINIVRFGWVLANTFSKSLCLFMFGKVMKPIPIKLLRVHKNL